VPADRGQHECLGATPAQQRFGAADIDCERARFPGQLGGARVATGPVTEVRVEMEVIREVVRPGSRDPLRQRLLSQLERQIHFSHHAVGLAPERERSRYRFPVGALGRERKRLLRDLERLRVAFEPVCRPAQGKEGLQPLLADELGEQRSELLAGAHEILER
jgi:hypothetical protein